MAQTDVWLKQVGKEFLVAEDEKQLAFKNTCSKSVLKLLWMWVLFDDGWDALKKLKQEQHCLTNCRVVTCTAVIPHNTCQVDELIHGDCRVTTYAIFSLLSTSKGSIKAIIEEFGYSKVCACSVPWMLTGECKDTRTAFTTDLCTNMTLEVKASHCLTVIWVNHFEPESKKHMIEKQQTTTPRKNKLRVCHQLEKSWLQTFGMTKVSVLWASFLGRQEWTQNAVMKH